MTVERQRSRLGKPKVASFRSEPRKHKEARGVERLSLHPQNIRNAA